MRLLLIPLILISIAACEPSQQEKDVIVAASCDEMADSLNALDTAFRIKKINEVREKIAAEPLPTGSEDAITEAFEFDLCKAFVLNDEYEAKLKNKKAAVLAERQRVAAVTCAVIDETDLYQAVFRVEKINEAREKLGSDPFLNGDGVILESLAADLCEELVLNNDYDNKVQPFREAKAELARLEMEAQRI